MPARVVLQDFTGVPAVVDLAAMRSAVARLGGDPQRINPLVPADLVIDHSVQVDVFGSPQAFGINVQKEYERNRERGTPLVVIAGKEYGSGSSRDWAAKGTLLLGVKAVLAESYERIHRSNLIGMGILPLQFKPGESRKTLGLDGRETYEILGLSDALRPRSELTVRARRDDGRVSSFTAIARADSPIEVAYLRHGGIPQMVLRSMTRAA